MPKGWDILLISGSSAEVKQLEILVVLMSSNTLYSTCFFP